MGIMETKMDTSMVSFSMILGITGGGGGQANGHLIL